MGMGATGPRGNPGAADQVGGFGGGGGGGLDWFERARAHAEFVLNRNGVQVARPIPVDFLHTPGDISVGANPPTFDDTDYSGGVYQFSGPGFGSIYPFGSTGPALINQPKTIPWYLRTQMRVEAAAAASGALCLPLRLINATPHIIECGWQQTTSGTVAQVIFDNGSIGGPFSCGSVGTLGSPTCPVQAFFDVAMWMDMLAGTFNVSFSDQIALTLAGIQLNDMPVDKLQWQVLSDDSALLLKVGALFAMLPDL